MMSRLKLSSMVVWPIVIGLLLTFTVPIFTVPIGSSVFAQENSITGSDGQVQEAQADRAESESPSESELESESESNTSQTDSSDDDAEEESALSGFLRTPPLGYMFQGGVFMWPILLMAIVAAGVIIERYRSLRMIENNSLQVRSHVRELLEGDRVMEAFEFCNGEEGPVPAVLATGLRKYVVLQELDYEPAKIEEQVVKSMDDYGVHVVAALERHLPILATISSAAPMIGFLGTVQGMIVAFDDIVLKMGETNIVEAAASGIKVSLMTTCFGLIVGIPAFIAYNYFTSLVNRFVLDVEESASDLIESVTLAAALKRQAGQKS